jgi:hypothetical protein
MARLLLPTTAILSICIFYFSIANPTTELSVHVSNKPETAWMKALRDRGSEAAAYTKQKGFNTQLAFLLDMNIPSGSPRFFVYDLQADSIRMEGLVTHGSCNEWWLSKIKYSNVEGSGCTSLGRYKIGKSYHGRCGLAWKLHGLDAGNSNAFARYVVLHGHECVPEEATEEEICQSLGCPTVAPSFLQSLKPIINNSTKPVLLWIYDSSHEKADE